MCQIPAAINCRAWIARPRIRRRDAARMLRCRTRPVPANPERRGQRKNLRMHIHGVAAIALALVVPQLGASAHEAAADAAARSYFARACADKVERVAVYAPDSN